MKNQIVILVVLILTFSACKETKKTKPEAVIEKQPDTQSKDSITSQFAIEILDDAAHTIIDSKATIKVLANGFKWTEGPVWVADENYLLFSDIPNNKVYKLDAQNDTLTYLHPSGFSATDFTGTEPGSNGLLVNSKGELVLMQHGNRQVAIMNAPLSDPTEKYTPLVDNFEGKRLNSPNDGSFDTLGNLYFTDPPYGLPKGLNDPDKELDFQGVYCLIASGELNLLDKELKFPNGIAVSNDEKSLYVAVSDPEKAAWYKYDIVAPGKVANKKLFFDVTHLVGQDGQQGLPDGLKVNSKGFIFATGPGGVWIFDSEGKALARIHTGQRTANCALTKDEKRLFMTADDYVLAVDLK